MDQDKLIAIILEQSKILQDKLNNHFLKEYSKLHNIDPANGKFELKQEVITKRAYFIGGKKKKYALHIINKEGKEVDETDIKGFIMKRSDYPSLTKERISTIVDMILYPEEISFIKISNFIKETTKEISKLIMDGNKLICKPVSFNSEASDYKVIPSHIKGMLLWNELEYKYFVPGTKGYEYKIKGVDMFLAPEKILNKVAELGEIHNNIVLPYEVDFLPKYYQINIEEQLKYSWEDRVTELLGTIYDKLTFLEESFDMPDSL